MVANKTPIGKMAIRSSKDLKISFRNARIDEITKLKLLYESAWGEGITISQDQLTAQIAHFPQWQIVGCLEGSDDPVTMINILPAIFDPKTGFQGGYSAFTGDKTFSTGLSVDRIGMELDRNEDALAIAFCVSVAVQPRYSKIGLAAKTIEYAIGVADERGMIAAPYSAPRGYMRALERNPRLEIMDYLHMTMPRPRDQDVSIQFARLEARIKRLNDERHRITEAFGGHIDLPDQSFFEFYHSFGADPSFATTDSSVFGFFLERDAGHLSERYGRSMTIEDFCLLTGRVLRDPVLGMHQHLGARFIRDEDDCISAIFRGSRPEDSASGGYNIVMTYGYHPSLGQRF